MSSVSKSEMKSPVELTTMPYESLCDVYICFNDIANQSARLLSSSTQSFSSSCECSQSTSLKHWSVLLSYGDLKCVCEALEAGGKLVSQMRPWLEKNQTTWERMTPKVHLGKYNIPRDQLMTILAQLNKDEDYSLVRNNCQHWAKKLLKEFGIDLDPASFMKQMNIIDRLLYKLMHRDTV